MSNILSYLVCGCAILQDGSRSWCPTCSSPVVLPAKEEQVAELRDGLAAAQKEANGLREALQFADARHHELRVANEALHLAVREKNYWAWQGDGNDHLESLVCPVLIRPEQLRALLNANAAQLHLAQVLLFEIYDEGLALRHDEGCPEDDTCECKVIARLNEALKGFKP